MLAPIAVHSRLQEESSTSCCSLLPCNLEHADEEDAILSDGADAILSDIHVGSDQSDTLWTLRYQRAVGGASGATDADGDLDPPRKRTLTLLIEHARATPLAQVGLQVWRGALVVCDWLLDEDAKRPWRGATIAELGGGGGAASVLAAALGANVFCTDGCGAAVALADKNAVRNAAAIEAAGGRLVAELVDWRAYADADGDDALGTADVILAADCIYDDAATGALFDALARALRLRPGRYAVVALEKRFNFEAESLSVVAHGYRTFHKALAGFDAVQLPLPARAVDYDRGDTNALELWRLAAAP